jgi:chromosome segregation ATPase
MSTRNTKNTKYKKKEKEMSSSKSIIAPEIKHQIIKLIDERIKEAHITKEDFSELKSIVHDIAIAQKELVEAQKRTEARVEQLAEAQKRTEARVEELVEAQKRTDEHVKELAEAQKRTEFRLEELAEAQKRTEARVEELVEAQKRTDEQVKELAEAQKRTEFRVEELAEAQKRTETRVEELAEAQKQTEIEVKKLAIGLHEVRVELGGLSRSFSYAFENEAYRNLPKLLKEKYGYELVERIVRADIGGKEINFFAKALKDGKEYFIVGESKVRLESHWRKDAFEELEEKVKAVKAVYGDVNIVKLLVTHFAKGGVVEEAEKSGILIVQSYEW